MNVGGVLISGIHAAFLDADRKELWVELEKMNEKKGGREPLRVTMQDFPEVLNVFNLIHAPSSCGGEKYSDHSPLLGSCVNIPKLKNLPFRVLKIWLEYEDFKRLIKEIWKEEVRGNPMFVFMQKMKIMKLKIKEWNWAVFGDIRVKLAKAGEEVLEATLISDKSLNNITLLNNLVVTRGKQEILTQQYQSILQQKSREKWLKDGATNTIFFHTSIKIRQNVNAITELEDDNGTISTDE
ncbi:uncharacterized protein LOC113338510 [Papaver somniferum]|uniref:uncharacterized protein LOC113338510 n=1 Tax=Papaver somniferum TaxID=3469 RepID=UPI000E6FFFF9|nr:uncharacterized protein LOC113338510 [Papaver somniferum]